MFWAVLVLSSVALSSADVADLFRRSRQLDLGLQDVSKPGARPEVLKPNLDPRQSSFQQPGYLPPEQGANTNEDVKVVAPPAPTTTTTTTERQYLKTYNAPSKDLAPPYNDIEEPKPQTTRAPIFTTTYRTTTTTRRPITTTTRRPTTTTRRPTTTTTRRPTTTVAPRLPAPSNEERSYLPPEQPLAPAAASDSLSVVKPQEDDDHHHHHHHRNICEDPFHSFLCDPLKPRKRITGALPGNPVAQNTFLMSRRVRPDPELNPAPSNEVDRQYLPPNVPAPSNQDPVILIPSTTTTQRTTTTRRPTTTTTRRPTTTTRRTTTTQRYIPQASNEVDRQYLPPASSNQQPVIIIPSTTTRRPTTTTRRPTTTTQRTTTTRRTTTTQRFIPEASNEVDRAYLPPAASNQIVFTTKKPRIVPQPSNTFREYVPPVTTTRRPTTTTRRPTTQRVVPAATNVDNAYLPPSFEPAAASNDPAIIKPNTNPHHHGRDLCTDPFHSFLCSTTKKRTRITGALPPGFDPKLPAGTFLDETRVKPQIPKEIAPAPSNNNPGYAYPKPDNGYQYPKPQKPLPLPSETKETVGYSYPKPQKPFPSEQKETIGYSYPKPDRSLPLPTEQKEVIGYNYPKPQQELVLPNEQKGYAYPKPEKTFPLPTEQKTVIIGKKEFGRQTGNTFQSASAEFIPVNKGIFKRDNQFGERLIKKERRTVSY